jgi:nucleoside phosphorylase
MLLGNAPPVSGLLGKHAGMGIVVGVRRVLTCAHVVNTAIGHDVDSSAQPDRTVQIVFPHSDSKHAIEGNVVVWHPMGAKPVGDVAVIELNADVPPDVGVATFVGDGRVLDGDPLMVFGYRAGGESGLHVEAKFMGPTGSGSVQIDGVKFTGVFVEGGYSGAAVWDATCGAVVGMVSAKHTSAADRVAYMIPVGSLRKAWPHLGMKAAGGNTTGGVAAGPPNHLSQLPGRLGDFVGREKEAGIDVLIITALKEEHDAARDVAAQMGVAWEERHGGTTTPYLLGRYAVTGKHDLTIALARPTRMGSTATAPIMGSLTADLKPHCLAMCGVCAGNPAEVALGDVIIADMVYTYDEGKQTQGGFEGDHRQTPMLDLWVRLAQELAPNDLPSFGEPSSKEAGRWLLERLYAGDDPTAHPARRRYFPKGTWARRVRSLEKKGLILRQGTQLVLTDAGRVDIQESNFYNAEIPEKLPFQIKVGPIASGNVVVKDGLTWDKLKMWGVRSVLGLEMEAATVGSTAHRLGIPGWVVVKGVMDHADPRKDDRYKPFAARASAEVLFKFLAMLPLPSLSGLLVPQSPTSLQGVAVPPPSTSDTPGRLFQLPGLLSDFVGREKEVSELVSRLRRDGGRVGLSALKGMGGVGKTTLAIRVAHEVKDRFPDAQLFLNLQGVAERPVTAAEAMARFIRDFHPEVPKLPESEAELLPIYRSTLRGKRVLIVLDNAADESQVKNLIAGDRTGFIITSRRALALDEVLSVELDVLSFEKSLQLLRGIVGAKGTDDELGTVAQLCGHLPLALRVAGDFLRLKAGWTVAQYIAALNEERHRWLKIGTDPQKDVEYVLKLSSAQLVRDNVDLATRWHYLADWPADFAADAAAAAWDMASDEHTVREDLSKLVDRSLVLLDEKSFRYRLHDLMKPIAAGLFA